MQSVFSTSALKECTLCRGTTLSDGGQGQVGGDPSGGTTGHVLCGYVLLRSLGGHLVGLYIRVRLTARLSALLSYASAYVSILRVDDHDHAELAVHALGAVQEHWLGVLNLNVEGSDRRAIGDTRDEAAVNSVGLHVPKRQAWCLNVRSLGDGVVVGPELELNDVAGLSSHDLRVEEQRLLASRATDEDWDDLGSRSGRSTRGRHGSRSRWCLALCNRVSSGS